MLRHAGKISFYLLEMEIECFNTSYLNLWILKDEDNQDGLTIISLSPIEKFTGGF